MQSEISSCCSSSGERSLESSDKNDVLETMIRRAAMRLGYKELKQEQTECIMELVKGRDVFVSLPTGFGKSLCYILLPVVFDEIRKVDKQSIALVVSPLVALMKDQVSAVTEMGVSAIHITDKHTAKASIKQSVKNGEYQIIFISPEALVGTMEWRSMLATDVYMNNLVAFVIDEAHCIKKWGQTFRKEFSHLEEVRSIVSESVPLMALTATATLSTRKFIIKSMCMNNPAIVYSPPIKNNIIHFVSDKPKGGIPEAFQPIAAKLTKEREMGRVIVFCHSYSDAIAIHSYLVSALGESYTEPKGSPNFVKYRVVDLYSHCTHSSVKDKLLQLFTSSSVLRVIVATTAFGMGVDCPDVRQVIHWGVPEDAEMYIQESGRAGRDGNPALAIILKNSKDMIHVSHEMKNYCSATNSCRKEILFSYFPGCKWSSGSCMCCDICAKVCKYGQCDIKLNSFFNESVLIHSKF